MSAPGPTTVYIARSIAYFSDTNLIERAAAYVRKSAYRDDFDLVELARINTKRPRQAEAAFPMLRRFVERNWPNFRLNEPGAELQAIAFFQARLKQHLDGACLPHDVCRMDSPIEQIYDFPKWLGDMYNACDWIGPETRPVDCRHLEDEIRETFNAI